MKLATAFTTFVLLLTACQSQTASQPIAKKFKEKDNIAVFTTKFVVIDKRDITKVFHSKDDGAWDFFSNDEVPDLTKVAKIAGLGQIIKIDSTVLQLADMQEGYFAHRKFKGDKWVIEKSE